MISRKNILELEPRKNIYSYISKNPGLHLREISRRLEIPYATLKYHLRYLEKQNLITSKFENEYKRYFVTNKLGKKEKEILVFLRQEVPSNILIYLMFHYVFSQTEISVALGKEPSTIDFHLKKLKKANIIEVLPKKPNFDDGWGIVVKRNTISNEKLYSFAEDTLLKSMYNLAIIYKDGLPSKSLLNKLLYVSTEAFGKHFDKKLRPIKTPKPYNKINTPNCGFNSAIEAFYKIFPNPYCL